MGIFLGSTRFRPFYHAEYSDRQHPRCGEKADQDLKSDGPEFLTKFNDAANVYQQGGDSFVSYIAWGGQYMASYSFTAHDDASYTSLVNSTNANISAGVSSFSASLTVALTQIHTDTSVNYTFLQQGVGFSKGQLPDQDHNHMIDFVLDFGDKVLDEPAIVEYATTSYHVVPGCPKFQQIDNYRLVYLGGVAANTGYAAIEAAAKANLPIVQNVYDMYKRYGVLSVDPQLEAHIHALSAGIQSIDQWRQAVDNNPTGTGIRPPNVNIPLDLPTPAYLIQNGGVLGKSLILILPSQPRLLRPSRLGGRPCDGRRSARLDCTGHHSKNAVGLFRHLWYTRYAIDHTILPIVHQSGYIRLS